MMDWLFGKRMTPDEMLRKNQRALNKAMRDLDREKMKMEQQEKKVKTTLAITLKLCNYACITYIPAITSDILFWK